MHAAAGRVGNNLSLVDDDTIEHEILSSRLALAMMDRASWEFTDLRSRMNMLEKRDELDANDILRPHVLARIVTSSWLAAPLSFDAWRMLQSVVHEELSLFAEESYHEINRFLLQRHVLPEVDLRPFIRRSNTGGPRAGDRRERRLRRADRDRSATDFQGSGRRAANTATRGCRGDAPDDARGRAWRAAASQPAAVLEPPQPPRRPPAARLRGHVAGADARRRRG